MGMLVLLAACGGKRIQVAVPVPNAPVASDELEGIASYYAEPYHGRRTANGEVFDTYKAMTAAHRTLPFNTVVRVTNKRNGRKVEVRINDRGPFIDGRVIDLSLVAAREIDMVRAGVVPVRLEIIKEGDVQTRRSAGPPVYAVQVGAFETLTAAEDLKRKLDRKYSGVTVQTASGRKTVYRVRVGRDPDIMAAHKLAEQLRKEALDTFVVRVN